MAPFSVNTHLFDPYKNFNFRIIWDGKYVAGVSKISSLKQSTGTVNYREKGDPSNSRVSPSAWKFEPITLERGVTHDAEFWVWVNKNPSENVRKNIIIELLNEQGSVAKAYKVYRCWVSECKALPELDASANAVAIESMVLQNEGWEQYTDVSDTTDT
jgi:phage tail-like protein